MGRASWVESIDEEKKCKMFSIFQSTIWCLTNRCVSRSLTFSSSFTNREHDFYLRITTIGLLVFRRSSIESSNGNISERGTSVVRRPWIIFLSSFFLSEVENVNRKTFLFVKNVDFVFFFAEDENRSVVLNSLICIRWISIRCRRTSIRVVRRLRCRCIRKKSCCVMRPI